MEAKGKKTVDTIVLMLPFKAEYVSVARLTASGVANRIGFNIEEIEDIRVAVAEVCNKLISMGDTVDASYEIAFKVSEKRLDIVFTCDGKSLPPIFGSDDDGLGAAIINALMDEVEVGDGRTSILSMSKSVGENGYGG